MDSTVQYLTALGLADILVSTADARVKDAAGPAFPEAQGAQREAIEQIRNASPRQILDYMNERSEAINE